MSRNGLRFGIMCTGLQFTGWQAESIRSLLALPGVTPELLIIDDTPPPPPTSWGRKLAQLGPGGALLWNQYAQRRVRRREGMVDLLAELADVPQIRCQVERRGRFSQYFAPDDVAQIRAGELDFILRYGFDIIRGDILDTARYGVWSFHHGDLTQFRGMPACFWELYTGAEVVGATLQRLTDKLDGGRALQRGWFATIPKSYTRTRRAVTSGSADFPARVCRRILAGKTEDLDLPPEETKAPLYLRPGNVQMLRFAAGRLWHKLADPLRWLFVHEQWDVGRIARPIETLLKDPQPQIEWMQICDRGRFIADPFAQRVDGALQVVFEDFTHAEGLGVISASRWPDGGPPEPARRVYTSEGHLSYPFLLSHQDQIYCLPEMADRRRVLLLRAESFPATWREVATLVDDVPAIDPTLFQHDERWWLLFSTKRGEAGLDLHAYYADELTGPYQPHPGNPLKTDIRSTRPAGTPFVHEGRLYRPAQDCAGTYGGRIVLNEIRHLTPERFDEEPVQWIAPDPRSRYRHGTHTLSSAGPYTVIDGKRRLFVPSAFWLELRKLLGKFVGRSSTNRPTLTTAPEQRG